MSVFQTILKYIPRPFKSLQRALDIQVEWAAFKQNIKPHKFKIFAFFAITTYPIYNERMYKQLEKGKKYLLTLVQSNLQKDKPVPKIAENYVKELVDGILRDKNIKNQASGFVNQLSKKDLVQQGVLDLLLGVIKNPIFVEQAQQLGKKIVTVNANDKQIQQQLKSLVLKVLQSYEAQEEVKNLIQVVFTSEVATKTLVKLLTTSVNDENVKNALGESFKYAFRQVLNDQETVEQLKFFAYFLLRQFQKDQQIKGLMSTVIQKGIGYRKKNKDKELEKILKVSKGDQQQEDKKLSF